MISGTAEDNLNRHKVWECMDQARFTLLATRTDATSVNKHLQADQSFVII